MNVNPKEAIERVIQDCTKYLYEYRDWPNIYRLDNYYKTKYMEPLNDYLKSKSFKYGIQNDILGIIGEKDTSILFRPVQAIYGGEYTAVIKSGSEKMTIHIESDDENCYFTREGSIRFMIDPVNGLSKI